MLKIETDFTSQSAGQLLTRIQAFSETIEGADDTNPGKEISEEAKKRMESGVDYPYSSNVAQLPAKMVRQITAEDFL